MKKATLYVSFFLNNQIFDLSDEVKNRDNVLQWFYDLKLAFAAEGYDLATQDIHPPAESEIVMYHDLQKLAMDKIEKRKSFLMIMEPPTVKRRAWKVKYHKYFNKVFTYYEPFLKNDRYRKLNHINYLPDTERGSRARKTKFCTTIISQKTSDHPYQLYSKRIEAIRWFEKHHPDQFDFYGFGWEGFTVPADGLLSRLQRRREPLTSYRGPVKAKLDTLREYRFAFAFENCRNVSGYISEKIFDCFLAGTVPIYLGAPDVEEHIPPDCFIDFRHFDSFEALYERLTTLSNSEYDRYIDGAYEFLRSSASDPFRSRVASKTVVRAVLDAL